MANSSLLGTCPRQCPTVSQAGWAPPEVQPGTGVKGIAPFPKPAAHRPWAHTTGLTPKIPQVPPCSISGSSRVPRSWVAIASLQR